MKTALIVIFVCSFCAAEDPKPIAQELLARAAQVGNLESAAKGPYRIEYHFKMRGFATTDIEGTYSRLWASPEKVREEFSAPGFTETIVRNGNKLWISHSLAYEPGTFNSLRLALNPVLRMQPDETVRKISKMKSAGEQLQCVDFERKDGSRSLCFDDAGGVLVKTETAASRKEYFDFGNAGPSTIPRGIRAFNGGDWEYEAKLVSFASQPSPPDSTFARPAASEEWATCTSPTQPSVLHTPTIEYPPIARSGRIQGSVQLHGVVEADGTVRNLVIVKSGNKVLENPALDAAKNMRYTPAACDGVPIRTEVFITVNFLLSGANLVPGY